MRTTLTLEEDDAVQIDELRHRDRKSLKAVVNEALRLGLQEMEAAGKATRKPFKMKTFDVGRVLVPSVDKIGDVLDWLDGEDQT